MGTDAFGQVLGQYLDKWLAVQGPAKKMAEESKIAIRNERRDALKHVETLVKDKNAHISEDEGKKRKDEIETMTKKHIEQIDQMANKKSTEITQV
jgi:ribosome recycling factor